MSYLTEEWDEKTLSWKKAVYAEKPVEDQGFWSACGNSIPTCGNPIEALLSDVKLSESQKN